MAVYDRWHLTHRPEGAEPCRCGRGKNKLYPSKDHGCPARWQVRWRASAEDGEVKQRKRDFRLKGGGADETDPERFAEAFNAKVAGDLNTGVYTDPKLGRQELREFAAAWRAAMVANISSLSAYDRKLAHISGAGSPIARRPMLTLATRPSLLQEWIKWLEDEQQLGPGYIKQIFDMLSSLFIAAMDDGVVSRNPTRARSLRLPTIPERILTPWTREQVAAARAQLATRDLGAMVDLGVGCGLRQGEIFGLAETDIQRLGADRKLRVRRQVKYLVEDKALVFAPPKRGKQREIPLPPTVERALAAHMRRTPPREVTLPWERGHGRPVTERLLFVRRTARGDGLPYHRTGFGYLWQEVRQAVGVEPAPENGMHGLRHTFASYQLAAGVDLLKVSKWLGHASAAFTAEVYGHFIPDAEGRGTAAADAFLVLPDEGKIVGQCALDVP